MSQEQPMKPQMGEEAQEHHNNASAHIQEHKDLSIKAMDNIETSVSARRAATNEPSNGGQVNTIRYTLVYVMFFFKNIACMSCKK